MNPLEVSPLSQVTGYQELVSGFDAKTFKRRLVGMSLAQGVKQEQDNS